MEIEYGDPDLRCLAEDPTSGRTDWDRATVVAYRKKIQCIRSAVDERDLLGARTLHLEESEREGAAMWSVRLSRQIRLNLSIRTSGPGSVTAVLKLANCNRRETSR